MSADQRQIAGEQVLKHHFPLPPVWQLYIHSSPTETSLCFILKGRLGKVKCLGQVGSNTTEILGIPAEMGLT